MRDLVFVAVFLVLCFFALRRSYVAVSIWLWVALLVPPHWLYGFAAGIRFNVIVALLALVSYVASSDKPKFETNALFWVVILFFTQTALSSLFAVIDYELVFSELEKFAKIILLFIMICLVFRTKNQFELLIYAVIFSVVLFGTVEGLKFLSSGGGHRIAGPNGHLLSDNNHFALALAMTLPMQAYMIRYADNRYFRWAMVLSIGVCILSILGTHSRGGFIGLSIVGIYFWLKARKKVLVTVGMMFVLLVSSVLLPQSWFQRMDTFEMATEDASFSTRMVSWKVHTLMALERPLVGGGFKSVQHGYVWNELATDFGVLDFIPTSPPGTKAWAAHSNYFQVLGDHGILGLFLYLLIIFFCFRTLQSIQTQFRKAGKRDCWQVDLSKMLRVSLVAYCVTGAAVSMSYFELFYGIAGLIVCLKISADAELKRMVSVNS